MSDKSRQLVSVIIPAYNCRDHIGGCIRTCLEQTHQKLEIIVVDDGSSDDTFETAKVYDTDPRLRVIRQKNKGACSARNNGLRLSTGDYYQFLDADDLLGHDKIEKQVNALQQNPGKMAVCTTVHFFDGEDPYKKPLPDESFFIHTTGDPAGFLTRLWGGEEKTSMVQTSAWLTPKEIIRTIGPWDESLLLDQDGEYFARAVLASNGLVSTGGINYYRKYFYGKNVAGQSFKKKNLESALRSLEKKTGYLLEKRDDASVRRAIATQLMDLAVNAWPQYPELTSKVLKKMKAQGQKPRIPVLGGKEIELIKKLMGWKTAKFISYHHHKKWIHREKTYPST